jgi:predicted NAD-dependent protein-ADP-ribosyltransferase YbiA (DUF1768 family)
MSDITFYGASRLYGEFSNFYPRSFFVEGALWQDNEHFYQAMKSMDPAVQEHVRTQIKSPADAARYGRREILCREDWNSSVVITPAAIEMFSDEKGLVVDRVKDHFMYQGLVAKFTQHQDLAHVLVNTGNATIVENAPHDEYWGIGLSKAGLNKLGRMLMLVRKNLVLHTSKSV